MRMNPLMGLGCLAMGALPLLIVGCGGEPTGGPANNPTTSASARPPIPPGYSSRTIHVKFRADTDVEQPLETLPSSLRRAVASYNKLFTLPQRKLNELRAKGKSRSGKTLPDLALWVQFTLQPGADSAAFLEELKRLPRVEIAEPAPLPQPLPATTPDFSGNQGYLDTAPGGIGARFSHTIPGGNGKGIRIYDVEYSWYQTHEDLSKVYGIPLLLNPEDSAIDPHENSHHGTAVLGVMVADDNAKGVTGISWGADVGLAPANTADLGYNPANAVLLAVDHGTPGDVILIEQQVVVCGLGSAQFGPSEWTFSVFDAIQFAVEQGFVVIEAAGNGNVNLDQPACAGLFDRTVRDSGAIIVGAGHPPGSGADRQRIGYSSFGSRVDLQGWGSGVVTTGGGDLYQNPDAATNRDFWYTDTFSGTSSASPMVAGAAANLQGIAVHRTGIPLTPFEIRTLLVQTGTPQMGNTAEHIGPRPDLGQAYAQLARQFPFTITLLKAGSGNGLVLSTPAGIDCGNVCTATFNAGTTVVLLALPGSGSVFAGWSGACNGMDACLVSSTNTVSATFNALPPPMFTVAIKKTGTGTGSITSDPAGISCDPTCDAQFVAGTAVTLTATPEDGFVFSGWSGASCLGTGPCVVTTTATLTATFSAPAPAPPPPSDAGGGGCTLAQGDMSDALMPTLFLAMLGTLAWRVRRR